MTDELRRAMRRHRIAKIACYEYQRQRGDRNGPMLMGEWLDTAHLDHWYALQRAGIPASRAGELCAAISRTRLPR